jgi:hypothetical protein
LKKPNKVPIRQFVQRVQQLNGYLNLLSSLFFSKRTTKLTNKVEPFDDADLASHILRMVPKHSQDQYKLMGGTVPQSMRKLLKVLERIKKAFPAEKECEGPKASMTGGDSSKKLMASFSDQIPKKSHKKAKYCALCKRHGGAQNTHNTGECRKHEKDGTPKRAFAGKSMQRRNPHNRNALCKHNNSYVQFSVKIMKLEKCNKKLKHVNIKCKRNRGGNSDNSDSS